MFIINYFKKHPEENNMTYLQHMCFSLHLSAAFLSASMCAFVHAIVPELFKTSSSDLVRSLNKLLHD